MQEEVTYICDACGEEIVIPVDLSAGMKQAFVADCPVCCLPAGRSNEPDSGPDQ